MARKNTKNLESNYKEVYLYTKYNTYRLMKGDSNGYKRGTVGYY